MRQRRLPNFHDAAAFYSLKANVDLGLAFVTEFERAAEIVLSNPKLGVEFRGPWRRYILRRFPFSIIYRTVAGELQIFAVAYHKRRPGYWLKRK